MSQWTSKFGTSVYLEFMIKQILFKRIYWVSVIAVKRRSSEISFSDPRVINQSLIESCNIHKMNHGHVGIGRGPVRHHAGRLGLHSVRNSVVVDDNAAIGPAICIMDCSAERVVRSPLIQLSRSAMCRTVITEYGINHFTDV